MENLKGKMKTSLALLTHQLSIQTRDFSCSHMCSHMSNLVTLDSSAHPKLTLPMDAHPMVKSEGKLLAEGPLLKQAHDLLDVWRDPNIC